MNFNLLILLMMCYIYVIRVIFLYCLIKKCNRKIKRKIIVDCKIIVLVLNEFYIFLLLLLYLL